MAADLRYAADGQAWIGQMEGRMPSQIRAAEAAINPPTAGDQLEPDLRAEAAALAYVCPAPAAEEERMAAAVAGDMQTPATSGSSRPSSTATSAPGKPAASELTRRRRR